MNIQPISKVNQTEPAEPAEEVIDFTKKNNSSSYALDSDTKQAIDQATGLLQSIVTDKLSEKVIRKMPSDEYLHLLGLLDDIISGSIDKHV